MQSSEPRRLSDGRVLLVWDLVVAVALVLVADVAYVVLPAGSLARLLWTAPALVFAPGYLVMQVARRQSTRRTRWMDAAFAFGVSPAAVALLALLTALLPSGFRPHNIVVSLTAGCFVLAFVAAARRARSYQPHSPAVDGRPRPLAAR